MSSPSARNFTSRNTAAVSTACVIPTIGVNGMDVKKSSVARNSMDKKESIALHVQTNTTIAKTIASLGVIYSLHQK